MTFWQTKTLAEMNTAEWESLCDGCAKCCLHKLEDDETGEVFFTNVACKLLDIPRCRCSNYHNRTISVPDCLNLRQCDLSQLDWLPSTCSYRLVFENKPLPDWHPLISGELDGAVTAFAAVNTFALSESEVHVDDMEDHIIEWLV